MISQMDPKFLRNLRFAKKWNGKVRFARLPVPRAGVHCALARAASEWDHTLSPLQPTAPTPCSQGRESEE